MYTHYVCVKTADAGAAWTVFPCQCVAAPTGLCPFELMFTIQPTGVSPLAKGDLYAGDQVQVGHFLSCLGYMGAQKYEKRHGNLKWAALRCS